MEWELISEETAEKVWDENLNRLSDCSPFQTYSWGEYNRTLGWKPLYFAVRDDRGEFIAMCLGLLRRYPLGVGLMWCVGGPVGEIPLWGEGLRKRVLSATGLKHLYFRFRCDRERNVNDVLFLNNAKWSRTSFMMTSGMSMELELSRTEEELLRALSRNWRRNLTQGRKNSLVIKQWLDPDIEEICRVYEDMENRKNLPEQFSREKMENLFKNVRRNLIFYRCEDEKGNLLCLRGCLAIGNRATDYLAATTQKGRELRASYPTLWHLLMQCKKQGVIYYDLGGIDPWANPGVYKFKKETGARETESLGEWDWATSEPLRLLGNWAIQRRQKAKPLKTASQNSSTPQLRELPAKAFG